MVEDTFSAKLQEASKQFSAGKFADCAQTLGGCPQDDPKVRHNLAVVQYLQTGGSVRDVLAALEAMPAVPNLPAELQYGTASGHHQHSHSQQLVGALAYDGHEIAHYNRAVVLLHNGMAEKAAAILRELVLVQPPLAPAMLVRIACLLQVATPAMGKRKRLSTDDAIINKIIQEHIGAIRSDPSLGRLMQVSFCETSGLHEWFSSSDKTPADKVAYYNNLGAVALNESKLHLASVYFTTAIKHIPDSDATGITAQSVFYNAGLCALGRGEYGAALKALLASQQSLKGSPLLWLRVAQAALGLHAQCAATAAASSYNDAQGRLVNEMTTTGCLLPGFALLQIPGALSMHVGDDRATNNALDTALKAVANTLALLVPAGSTVASAAEHLHNSGQVSLFRALQYAMLYAMYAEVGRSNYNVAASVSNDLLSLARSHALLPEITVSAATLAVEALCQLNKPAAALRLLQNLQPGDMIAAEGSESQRLRMQALFINLALVHIANGSWKAASTLANTLVSKYASAAGAQSASALALNGFSKGPAAGGAAGVAAGGAGAGPAGSAAGVDPAQQQQQLSQVPVHPPTTPAALATSADSDLSYSQIYRSGVLLQLYVELAQGNKDRALEFLRRNPLALPAV